MARMRSYNLAACTLIVAGRPISGYAEDGAILVEYPGQFAQDAVGGDGEVAVSRSNDQRAYVRVTLMEGTRSCRDLDEIAQEHDAAIQAGRPFPESDFLLEDPINGDRVSDSQFTFLDLPAPSKGARAGSREFLIVLPNGRRNARLAPLVV